MAYIKIDDYSLRITKEYLDQILAQAVENTGLTEEQVRQDSEETAYAEISAFLTGKYIIEDELAKDATAPVDDRNKIVLKCALDMSIYFIHWVINPRDVPELREKAYTNCREMLAAFRDGELIFLTPPASGGIAVRPIDEGGTRRVNIYSQIKFNSKPYSDFNSDLIFGEE
jgi:hypothetical protein